MLHGLSHAQAQEQASPSPKATLTKKKETRTIEFKVSGVCGMCKSRIENGALIKGVKFAEYDQDSSMLKVVYRTDKVTEDEIHKAVASVGHDTDKVEASDEAYAKLPGCCAYRGDIEKH